MKILVTGASGFIGHHVVQAVVSQGLRAFPVLRAGSDRRDLEAHADRIRVVDLADAASCREAVRGVDVVIHLAGLTRARSLQAFREVNVHGVSRLVTACHEAAPGLKRFVLVSSIAAAGPGVRSAPRRETDPCEPVTPYGVSKLEGEEALRAEAGSIPWTIVRPPVVYGPRERDVLTLFKLCRRGVVPIVGWRDKHYSVVYGPDLARAIVELALEPRASGRVFYVAERNVYSYMEFVGAIGRAMGRVPPRPRVPHLVPRIIALCGSLTQPFRRRPPLVSLSKLPEILAPGWVCATDAVREILGDVAPTDLERGARQTAAWYRESGWV